MSRGSSDQCKLYNALNFFSFNPRGTVLAESLLMIFACLLWWSSDEGEVCHNVDHPFAG